MYKQENYIKGREGEQIAKDFLLDKNFKFIESNYENKIGEIDLIMSDSNVLIFIEVKLKIGDKYGSPEEMINRNKLNQVMRVAQSYLVLNPEKYYLYKQFRIDAVCIVLNEFKQVKRINHYENVEINS